MADKWGRITARDGESDPDIINILREVRDHVLGRRTREKDGSKNMLKLVLSFLPHTREIVPKALNI